MKLTYRKDGRSYLVLGPNGANMGQLEVEIDGDYVWYPNRERFGFLTAWVLRDLADKLDELNGEQE